MNTTDRREMLLGWVTDALRELGGSASVRDASKAVWNKHSDELGREDFFYTWQYDIRWAVQALRRKGVLMTVEESPRGKWVLKE